MASRSPSPTSPRPEEEEERLFGNDDGRIHSDNEGSVKRVGDNSDDEDNKKKKKKSTKPKGPVRRQMISEDILSGRNGLKKLDELFKEFQFRGKGKEKEDLDRMLNTYEHWIHTMHPKYPFDQCLERIEFLGLKKKSVKTLVKRIRMGLVSSANDNDDRVVDDEDIETGNPEGGAEGDLGFDDDLDIGMIDELEYGATNGPGNTLNQNNEDDFPNPDELLEFEQSAAEAQKQRDILDDEMDIEITLAINEDDAMDPSEINLTKSQEDELLLDSPIKQVQQPNTDHLTAEKSPEEDSDDGDLHIVEDMEEVGESMDGELEPPSSPVLLTNGSKDNKQDLVGIETEAVNSDITLNTEQHSTNETELETTIVMGKEGMEP